MTMRDGLTSVVLAVMVFCVSDCGNASAPVVAPPDPGNELPFGFVDAPREHETVGRVVDVAGWALDESGVRAVRLYVDGKYNATTTSTIRRPDVARLYPTYTAKNPTPGWQTTVDLGETPGAHTVLAQAVDDRGATRDIGERKITLVAR